MPEFDVYVRVTADWTVRVTAKNKAEAMELVDTGKICYADKGDCIDETVDVEDADRV